MLVLQANKELENTFHKLIQTMKVQVAWDGRFVIMGDQLILEGKVRSLFFQFDTKKVRTDLIDLEIDDDQVLEISEHPKLQDLLNMVLYAFGKWGTLKGLRVEQDYAQLDQLFARVLKPYYIEPAFQKDNFRFYKENVRITYEEVFEIAIGSEEKPQEEPEGEEGEAQGLWHKLIWRNRERTFHKVETTLEERQNDRIGYNFYLVGYQCPKCAEKIYMAVYPVGKEVRIDTDEGGVFIARAYACDHCNCFYTPRPDRLLSETYIYEMAFGDDRKAYEDYSDLLGENAERTANFQYNEYEAVRKMRLDREQRETDGQQDELEDPHDAKGALQQIEAFSKKFDSLPDDVFRKFTHRVEEGFYPDAAVAKYEKKILEQVKKRREASRGQNNGRSDEKSSAGRRTDSPDREVSGSFIRQREKRRTEQDLADEKRSVQTAGQTIGEKTDIRSGADVGAGKSSARNAMGPSSPQAEKYRARLGVLGRLSDRQKMELKKQIQRDTSLDEEEKKELLRPMEEAEQQEMIAAVTKKADSCEKRNYAQIQKVIEEIEGEAEGEELSDEMRSILASISDRLQGLLKQRGAQEVRQIMEKIPERLDRAGYQELEKKLRAYDKVDMAPYQEVLREKREAAEKQEIANIVKRARKNSRKDHVVLMQRLEEQSFADENVAPYMEKIKDRLRKMDEQKLDEMCAHVQQMDFDTAAELYEQIEQGSFLPELKNNALELLSKRLEKIRTDECGLLVRKLQEEMQGTIRENARHHFYPARKVMLKTAEPEETRVIDAALHTYARDRGLFEYPILVADTSKNHSGREGMLLTPEHLYYSTRLRAYEIPVSAVDSVTATTGLLNRKVTLEEKNGAKHKLPYAVPVNEMQDWAEILEGFIQYLQEKPASRKLTYLAKETHDTICCFRCGFVYRDSAVCPECGYKKNR